MLSVLLYCNLYIYRQQTVKKTTLHMYGLLEAIILTLSCGLYLCKVVKSHILFIFYMDDILCIRVSDKIGCSLDITVKSLNAVSEKSLIDLDLNKV